MKNLLEYNGYHAKIEMSIEDEIFVGSVLGIDDSLNFYGNTMAELKEAFEVCIDDYIQMCEHFGKKPEKEYSGSFNVRVGAELHKKIDIASQEQGISINQFIINTLSNSFNNKEREIVYIALPVTKSIQNMVTEYNLKNYTKIAETVSSTSLQEVKKS
ncbi:MAG: type II toxin-antitoxin system HicB family antitoxin [Acutalibacteraceae bacterium]|nr:type II toxin-antitoxin system HicB family antitoxin [Acutalibacteraceae bacterium]